MFSIVSQQQEVTMSSLDFLNDYINPARKAAGEPLVGKQDFLRKVCDELELSRRDAKKLISEKINNLGFTVKRESIYFDLDYDQLMLVGMRESKAVRKVVLEKLKQLTKPKEDPIVLLAQKVLQQDAEIKKLEATKAQINDKRTATLMNKASQDAKRIKKLESRLQFAGEYKSLIAAGLPQRIETELNPEAQTWRVLKKLSNDMGFDMPRVVDPRYGSVRTYHVSVIERFKTDFMS